MATLKSRTPQGTYMYYDEDNWKTVDGHGDGDDDPHDREEQARAAGLGLVDGDGAGMIERALIEMEALGAGYSDEAALLWAITEDEPEE